MLGAEPGRAPRGGVRPFSAAEPRPLPGSRARWRSRSIDTRPSRRPSPNRSWRSPSPSRARAAATRARARGPRRPRPDADSAPCPSLRPPRSRPRSARRRGGDGRLLGRDPHQRQRRRRPSSPPRSATGSLGGPDRPTRRAGHRPSARAGQQGGAPGGTGTRGAGPHIVAASRSLPAARPADADRLIRLRRGTTPPRPATRGSRARRRAHPCARGRSRPPLGVLRETYEGSAGLPAHLRQGGHWTPPLDRQGDAVDTITVFRCTFTITF